MTTEILDINNSEEEVLTIKFNGELRTVESYCTIGYTMLTLDDNSEWYIFSSIESAEKAVKEYWFDLAYNDTDEFILMVGGETLISWARGQWAGPGRTKARSLNDWIDNISKHPFADWDSKEVSVDVLSQDLVDVLGYDYENNENTVIIYRETH